ncbi:MAG: ABC transporter ATP-binding protein [Clostridiales bacterium]|jgi:iron complex transport system ATP-binding protein|nr:ABC transporter ATP-binding protein [Clostridiales bacterium]
MDRFIRLEQLTVGYDGKPVVRDIEVSLRRGRILSLIGPNGSGKSTILKTITKQLKAIGGAVFIGENSVESLGPREMSRRMAAALTERSKPELMTCGEAAAAGRYPYTGMLGVLSKRDKEKVDEALRIVGVFELKNRLCSEVSDGQLQRITLARAICQEPEIIMLDEPTSFLDIRYAVEILDVLRQMANERGVAVVMSLHELNYAKRVSDLVMCVKDGRVLYLDTPDVIFTEAAISRLYDLPEGTYSQLFGGL